MKLLIATLTLLTSAAPAFAAAPSKSEADIARLLIANVDVTTQLKDHNTTALKDVATREVSPGVTEYVLLIDRDCFCLPTTAKVTITEDMTPTYRDGAPVYTSKVEFAE